MTASHDDLHRDIGRMEGRLDAMDDRLEKMEAVLDRIDGRLAKIESRESERKGAWKLTVSVSAGASAFIAWLVSNFGGHIR